MDKANIWRTWLRGCLCLLLICVMPWAHAGLSVYTDGTTSPVNPLANQRTIDFSTNTLATENTAGKITYSSSAGACDILLFVCSNSAGSIAYNGSNTGVTGYSGNVMVLSSGTNSHTTSVTINFSTNTPYVGFMWSPEFVSTNSMVVNITLSDNSVVALKNCTDTTNNLCLANYVSQSWWTNVNNALFGWLLGDTVVYYPVYVQYQPSGGLKIKAIQFAVTKCAGCGLLSADTSQDMKIDGIYYVDGSVAPDHMEISASSATVTAGTSTTYTIKACGNAACTTQYTTGVTGTWTFNGGTGTATAASGSYTINAGSDTTTFSSSLSAGTGNLGLSAYTPTPTATNKVLCAFAGAAASTTCTVTALGLHHIEVTNTVASSNVNNAITYTLKACANAACSTLYTGQVTGTLGFTGVTATGQAFTIAANGTSTTTVNITPTTAGTATATITSPSPTPTATGYCGMNSAAATNTATSCDLTINGPDHIEVTATSGTGYTNTAITYTVKACANAACSSTYSGGVSGALGISGVTVSGSTTPSFTIASGATTATVSVTPTASGTLTVATSGSLTPSMANAKPMFCGMGVAASSSAVCTMSIQQLDHIEVTTPAASVFQSSSVVYTIKACADSACTTTYTGGVTGNLALSSVTFSPASPQAFTIASGAATTTVTVSPTTGGSSTASTNTVSPTPANATPMFCGIGAAAASNGSCVLTIVGLDHLEVTTSSATGYKGTSVGFTIKACANASCSSTYSGGVTGNLVLSSLTFSPASPIAFTIGSGSTQVTVNTTPSTTGTSTASTSSVSPTPANGTPLFCGLGVTAASGNSCVLTVQGLDHLEVTTAVSSVFVNNAVTYTIKACANAACSTTYTGGVTGTLGLSGVTNSASSTAFTIAASASTTTVNSTPSTSGTMTAATSSVSPTPGNGTPLFCGIGAAAASGNTCGLTVYSLHHLEVTTASAGTVTNSTVTYTISACANAACTVQYTSGVTGNLVITGVTVTQGGTQAFSIGSGGATTTVSATLTTIGTATVSLSSISPTPGGSPSVYCGIGVTAASGNACDVSVASALHHVEVTTASASGVDNTGITFTIKSCGNAACSTLYTGGLTGNIAVTGTGLTPTYTGGVSFSIASGSSSTTKVVSLTPSGTATVALSSLSPAPSNTPAYFCGIGVAAASGNSCNITINPALHHLEVTTSSSVATSGSNVTFTVKACVDSACSTTYTLGATGTLSISGVTPTFSGGSGAFSVASGSATTTVVASMTQGTATVGVTSPSPTPTNSPAIYCGFGVAAASGNSCTLTVNPPLHHLEVTAGSATAVAGTNVTFTIKSCVDASCTVYTYGTTGTLAISGTTPTFSGGSGSYTIGSGSSTTTVIASMAPAGTATISISSPSPTPSGSPAVYCGFGLPATSLTPCTMVITPALHHMEVTTANSSSLTCANPVTFTIKACADASCGTLYTTGVTGNLSLTGSPTVNYASGSGFTILPTQSSTTVQAYITTVGTVTVGLSGVFPAATASPAVYCGLGTTASSGGSCNFAVAQSGFLFDVPNHVSDVGQTINVSAVRSSDSATVCTPAFQNVTKSVTFSCGYSNPTSGTLPVRVTPSGGSAVPLNAAGNASAACDGSGHAVSLSFNASGVATATFQYADVGSVNVAASYSGSGVEAGLSMTGSDNFIAVPASFAISGVTAGPIAAGNAFSATVTAKNNSGATTPNFGRETAAETVRLTWAKALPTGAASVSGTFTGTGVSPAAALGGFSSGAATASDLKWTEVGYGDLTATLTSGSYLGTGTNVTGTTGTGGAVGKFVPHHFSTAVTQACGAFTYSGQPYTVTITAQNASGGTTVNYNGTGATSPNYSQAVTLSAATNAGTGSMGSASVPASDFGAGVATETSPKFTFTNKLTSPTSVTIRATESGGSVSSASGTEGALSLRSGRVKVSNAFGSEKQSLSIPVQVQYWNGKTWVINSSDNCTSIPASAVARGNYVDYKGDPASWTTTPSSVTIVNGNGTLTLSAPSTGTTGSVDFAFNLGSGATDQSCASSHPSTTGASKDWLRAQNGSANSCAGVTTYDRDPSARATFGVFSPETKKAVYVRDIY